MAKIQNAVQQRTPRARRFRGCNTGSCDMARASPPTTVEELRQTNPLYVERAERALADKPPVRSSPLGVVAHTRSPGATTRSAMIARIREQDDLVRGPSFWYKPATVDGVELQLEPLQPAIGTIVHGLDLARPLSGTMVRFLRALWLERRVIGFREQQHITQHQMVAFAESFGEIGAPFGEREHVPNSPLDLNQQIKVPGIPDMLVLPADEDVPNAASGWHCDATWQPKPPMGSVLMCREAPPIGGDTCFCDCYGMWAGLPPAVKEKVAALKAEHVGSVGHAMDGKIPRAWHPVCRTHPETGEESLYVQQGFVQRVRNRRPFCFLIPLQW
jgi:alpha-ketoglutarate-dependent taurine dioxygenase